MRGAAGRPGGGPATRPTRTAHGRTEPSALRGGRTGRPRPPRAISGSSLGLFGYPEQAERQRDVIPKTALQYIENHDHERFLCNFGLYNPDEAGNPLFPEGDRCTVVHAPTLPNCAIIEQRYADAVAGPGTGRELFFSRFGRRPGLDSPAVAMGLFL